MTSRQSSRAYWLSLLLLPLSSVTSSCGSDGDDDTSSDPCAGTTLRNTVTASTWATRVARISSYRYSADRDKGETSVELLAASGEVLDTMRAWQSFGDAKVEDGAMVAELGGLRLTTRGLDLDASGYRVRARLAGEGKPTLIIDARFEGGRCYPKQADDSAGPACAGDLELAAAGVTLPSCGLVNDLWALADRPATLVRLDYAVPAREAKAAPAGGGIARTRADGDLHRLTVRTLDGVATSEALQKWLGDTGLDALVGSDAEVRLTTAFLDRSWWREVEKHVGYCQAAASAAAPTTKPPTTSKEQSLAVASVRQAQCAGDQSSSAWDGGGGGSSKRRNVWGDPHLVTLDGLAYDFQGAGEFVLVESIAGAPLKIHARFQPFANPVAEIPICAHVTFATVVATEVDGHVVSVHARPPAIYVDGEEVKQLSDLPALDQGEILIDDRDVTVAWPGGERLLLQRGNYLAVSITLPDSRQGQMAGLLGDFNGDATDDFRLRDGEPLAAPVPFEVLYTTYADSWRLLANESLLSYAAGESTETFTNFAIPGRPASLKDLPADARAEAEARCAEERIDDPRQLAGCILDVVCATSKEEADALARAASDAAPSSAGALPGDDALLAGGDALSVEPPQSAEGQELAVSSDVCQAPARRWLQAFAERASQTLAADLDVDLTGPGGGDDPSALAGGAVPAGTAVRSWLVHRDPADADASPLEGWLKFSDKIVGVIVEGNKLEASDGSLGAAETRYPKGAARGLEPGDAIAIEPDGKTLVLRLSGEDTDHVRVLTAEQEVNR